MKPLFTSMVKLVLEFGLERQFIRVLIKYIVLLQLPVWQVVVTCNVREREMVSSQIHLPAPDVAAAGALCVPCVKSADTEL